MIELKYRTFWRRFCAAWIDALILSPLIFLNDLIWGYHSHLSTFLLLLWYAIYCVVFPAYDIILHGKYGQTVGKMVMKVKVLDITESPLSMFKAFKREIIPLCFILVGFILDAPKVLSGVSIMNPNNFQYDVAFYFTMASTFGWFIVEMITMLFSRKRRALHDFIAGSVVIKLAQPLARADHSPLGCSG
jgi:uncharacterized RDD family membrane protein YckC